MNKHFLCAQRQSHESRDNKTKSRFLDNKINALFCSAGIGNVIDLKKGLENLILIFNQMVVLIGCYTEVKNFCWYSPTFKDRWFTREPLVYQIHDFFMFVFFMFIQTSIEYKIEMRYRYEKAVVIVGIDKNHTSNRREINFQPIVIFIWFTTSYPIHVP